MDRRWLIAGGVGIAAVGAVLSQAAPALRKSRAAAVPKAPAGPNPEIEALLARLKKEGAAVHSGRLSLLAVRRQGDVPAGATDATALEALRKAPVQSQRREYYLYSGSDWRRDITTMDAQGNVGAHYLLGMHDKVGRVVQEAGHAETAARQASIGPDLKLEDANHLLTGRVAPLLEGASWTSLKRAGGQAILEGTRAEQRLTLTLRTTPRYALDRLAVSETLATPQGDVPHTQVLTVTYEAGKSGLAPKGMEDLDFVTGAIRKGMVTKFTVEGAQANVAVKPEELPVEIPAGTKVTDQRFDPPLRYVAGEREFTMAELKAMAEKRGERVATVGRPAPQWDLKLLGGGKSARLQDYRGKVVLLTWFASW